MTNPLAAVTLIGPETAFTPAVGDQVLDGVATLTGGAQVALFEDYGAGQYELSINGGAPIVAGAMNDTALSGGGFSLEANSFLPGSRASIAALGNGEFIVTWVDGTVTTQNQIGGGSTSSGPTVLGQLYDAAGDPIGNQLVFSGDVVTMSSAQSVPATATVYAPVSVSALGTSDYLVAVPSTFASGLGSSDGAAFFGPPAMQAGLDLADQIAAGPFAEAAIATTNYAWVAYAIPGLFGGELTIKVTDFTGRLFSVAAIPSAGVQQLAVAQSATDSIALAWVEGSHVKVATAAESPAGLASLSLDLGTGSAPQVAAQANGLFAVTWQDADASGQGIYAELFYADGTAASQKIQINTITDGDQTAPHITALGNDQFLIGWTDASHEAVAGQTADSSGLGIKSQVVSFADPGVTPAITAITQSDPQHSIAAQVHYTVHFSEPVIGLTTSSFSLVTHGVSGASIASVTPVTGNYGEYVVTVNTGTGVGTIALHAAAGAIADFFGNPTTVATDSPAYDTFFSTVLSVTPSIASGTLGPGQQLTITVAMSDAVSVVGTPVLNLNDGGAAVYDAAHSTATSLVFDYTVGRGEQAGPLAVTGVGLQNASIIAVGGTAPNLSGLTSTFAGLAVNGANDGFMTAENAPLDALTVFPGVTAVDGFAAAVGQQIALGSGARLTVNADGSFSYDPHHAFDSLAAGATATDSFNYTVAGGTTAVATVTIDGVDTAPVAQAGAANGIENGRIAGTVTASDVDTAQAQLRFALSGTNGGAQHGAVLLNTDGTFTYTPDANYYGTDSFSFMANDGLLASNVASENLTVFFVDQPPAIGAPEKLPPITVDGGPDLITQAQLLGNASDAAGHALSAIHLAISSGSGTLVDNQDGTWSYTPAAGNSTAVSFSYQVTDGIAAPVADSASLDIAPQPAAHNPANGSANDFSGNGHSGILLQNADGTPAIWTVDGTSLVAGSSIGANPGSDWHVVGPGDFNGDGKSDILWQNKDGTIAEWFLNGTSLISGGSVGFNPGPAWHAIGSGDFDGNGKSDILFQNDDGTPSVWLMNGLNILSGANVGFNPGPSWHVVGAADFNGDGKSDVLWQNTNGQAAVWLMNGTNLLSGANVGFNPGADWHIVGTGDFNGDGKADILWQNRDGTPAIWLMNGTNLISGSNVGFNPGPSWHAVGTGDFNGDGKSDILWQNDDGTSAVWLMNGTSVISGANVGDPGSNWHVIPQHHDVLV